MRFKTPETIKTFKEVVFSAASVPFFTNLKIVDKNKMQLLLDDLYANLPVDLQEARTYLKARQYDIEAATKKNENNIFYDLLQELENELNKSIILFSNSALVDSKKFEELLSNLENNLPQEILKSEILAK